MISHDSDSSVIESSESEAGDEDERDDLDGQDWDINDDDEDAYIEGEVDEDNFPPEPVSLKSGNYVRQAYISDSRATR